MGHPLDQYQSDVRTWATRLHRESSAESEADTRKLNHECSVHQGGAGASAAKGFLVVFQNWRKIGERPDKSPP